MYHRDLSLVLCDDLEGWDGRVRGSLKGQGICVYLLLIHDALQQKTNIAL